MSTSHKYSSQFCGLLFAVLTVLEVSYSFCLERPCLINERSRGIFALPNSKLIEQSEQSVEVGSSLVSERTSTDSSRAEYKSNRPVSRTGHDLQAFVDSFTTCPSEFGPTVLDFPELPEDFPVGTYYRNGHAKFESGDVRVQHMFDGDGMVSAVTFDPQAKRVVFRNRFVRTTGFLNDSKTGGMTAPGVFGTRVSGGWLRNLFRLDFKNVANTHVLYTPTTKVLYALWEAGFPHKLDPYTLDTVHDTSTEPLGCDLDGLLQPGDSFSAHYRYDPISNTIVNFAVKLNPQQKITTIHLFEFDADTMKLTTSASSLPSVQFDGAGLIHDYALTKNWCVFSVPPASVNQKAILKAILGRGSFASVIGFDNDANETQLIMVPREVFSESNTGKTVFKVGQDDQLKIIRVPFHFGFHFANAFEETDADGESVVVVDMVQTTRGELGGSLSRDRPVWESVDFDTLSTNKYVRYTISPLEQRLIDEPEIIVNNRNAEFPTVPKARSTRRHRYTYACGTHNEIVPDPKTGLGSGALGALMKIDTVNNTNTEIYSFMPHEFIGEPCFVPKSKSSSFRDGLYMTDNNDDEDSGYVIVYVVNGIDKTTDLVLFDVQGRGSLAKGPVARLRFPTYIPPALHGTFVEGLSF